MSELKKYRLDVGSVANSVLFVLRKAELDRPHIRTEFSIHVDEYISIGLKEHVEKVLLGLSYGTSRVSSVRIINQTKGGYYIQGYVDPVGAEIPGDVHGAPLDESCEGYSEEYRG